MSDASPGRSLSEPKADPSVLNEPAKSPNSLTREPLNDDLNFDSDPELEKSKEEHESNREFSGSDLNMDLDPPSSHPFPDHSTTQPKDYSIDDELQFSDQEPENYQPDDFELDEENREDEPREPDMKMEPMGEPEFFETEPFPEDTHHVNEEPMSDHNEEPKDEKELVGLFEDSDEYETLEEKPKPQLHPVQQPKEELPEPVKEVQEVVNTSLNVIPKPDPEDRLVVCRFPPTFVVSRQNDIRSFLRANPYLLEHPPTTNNLSYLYFKHTLEGAGSPKSKPLGMNSGGPDKGWESNGKFVLWEDGSVTLFIGKVPLDCEFRPEISFLIEDSRQELKPVHSQVNLRLQTRFSNLLKNDLIKKKPKPKRQKMEVTSISEAIQSHHTLRQNMMNLRENERYKRSQYSSKGLTRSFLESSDEEDLV